MPRPCHPHLQCIPSGISFQLHTGPCHSLAWKFLSGSPWPWFLPLTSPLPHHTWPFLRTTGSLPLTARAMCKPLYTFAPPLRPCLAWGSGPSSPRGSSSHLQSSSPGSLAPPAPPGKSGSGHVLLLLILTAPQASSGIALICIWLLSLSAFVLSPDQKLADGCPRDPSLEPPPSLTKSLLMGGSQAPPAMCCHMFQSRQLSKRKNKTRCL